MKMCNRCNSNEIKGLEKFCLSCRKLNNSESEQRYRDKNKEKRNKLRRLEFEENFKITDPIDYQLIPKEFNKISKMSSASYRKHYQLNWVEVLSLFNKKSNYESYIQRQYKLFYEKTNKQDMVAFARSIGLTYALLQEIDIDNIRNSVGIKKMRNTDEDYENNFNSIKSKLGRSPLYNEFMKHSEIGIGAYANKYNLKGKVYDKVVEMFSSKDEFDNYKNMRLESKSNSAKEAHQGYRYTLEEMEVEFKKVYDNHLLTNENPPSRRVFNELSKFDDSTYRNRLDMTFSEVADFYGYEPNKSNTKTEKMVVGLFANILNSNPIPQAKFNWLKSIKNYPLKCDAYFEDHNLIVEFDGEQHSRAIEYWGGEKMFKIIQANDAIKNKLIPEHGLTLIRIAYNEPYWDEDFLRMRLIENNIMPPNYTKIKDSALVLSL